MGTVRLPVYAATKNPCNTNAVWTAFGCIQADPQQIVSEVLRIGLGLGGGVAFLLILIGGFRILTSAGDPEKLNNGREQATSAVIGLLLIIFSVFFLNFIGFNVFGIPGYGSAFPTGTSPASSTASTTPSQSYTPAESQINITGPTGVTPQGPVPTIDLTSDVNVKSPITLTASGATFVNGSADGLCTVADAACTLPSQQPGTCLDNGHGQGVCADTKPATDILYDTGCDPNTVCHIPPEKVGRRNDVGQSKTKDCGQRDCTGSLWSFVQNWIGEVHPQGIYHYGTPLLTAFGKQIFDAFSKDLYSAPLQQITLWDVQPKPYCMTSRVCVYDPVTHELVGNYLTQETWCTNDPPNRKELIMGTRLACGALSKCTTPTNLQLPYTAVKKIAALPCGAKLTAGRSMDLLDQDFVKTNYYGDDTITHFLITIQADMVSIIQKVLKSGRIVDVFMATEHTPAVDVGSAENGLSASLGCTSFTCTQKDLEPFAYPDAAGKAALAQNGGIWDTYRNNAYDVSFQTPLDARYETQTWFYGMAGEGEVQSPTLQSMNARQENSQLFGNCSITNAAMQPIVFTGGECNQNWIGTTATSNAIASIAPSEPEIRSSAIADSQNTATGTNVKAVSPQGPIKSIASNLVPACVLDGIATVEGAYESGAPCSNNECGAYGPFQITTGNCKPSCGASSCPNEAKAYGATTQQLCDFGTASGIAAQILVGKASYWKTPLSATATVQSQKAAIINAADSYYGVGSPITRLGGLSYGEWVYAHCSQNETVTHVTHDVGHYLGTP